MAKSKFTWNIYLLNIQKILNKIDDWMRMLDTVAVFLAVILELGIKQC